MRISFAANREPPPLGCTLHYSGGMYSNKAGEDRGANPPAVKFPTLQRRFSPWNYSEVSLLLGKFQSCSTLGKSPHGELISRSLLQVSVNREANGRSPIASCELDSRACSAEKLAAKRDAGCPPGWKLVLLFPRGPDDLGEAAWVQAGPTYESAVDVQLTH